MSNPDPNKIIFSSRYRYFLNRSVEVGQVSITAQSIPSLEYRSFNLSIPIDNADDHTQIKVNFSHDSGNWSVYPFYNYRLDANFSIEVTASYTGSTLSLTFYVVNQTPGTETNTATDVTVRVYVFEPSA